jgi:DNA-binding MarR family transcriptional regulator
VLTKKEEKQFLPHLMSRILLFLRQQQYAQDAMLTEDLIKKFNKSKSRISQTLSFLSNNGYIERGYVPYHNNHGSRHVISLTQRGLEIAEAIILDGLDPLEKKVIEALKNRFY